MSTAKSKANNTTVEEAQVIEPVAETAPPTEATAEAAAETPAAAPAAEPAPVEVPIISKHQLFRTLATPTQNAKAEQPKAEGGEGGEATSTKSGSEGTPTGSDGNTTPGTENAPTGTAGGGGNIGTTAKMAGAKSAVGLFDFIWAIALGFAFKELKNQTAKYRATESEKNELAEAVAEVLAHENINVGPYTRLIMTALAVYGFKGYAAYEDNERQKIAEAHIIHQQIKNNSQQQRNYDTVGNAAKDIMDGAPTVQGNTPANTASNSPIPLPGVQTYPKCPTCGEAVTKGTYCDLKCAKRYQSDMGRRAAGKPMLYVGLSKADANKLAPKKATKKPTAKKK
jgi:hypothetical protein